MGTSDTLTIRELEWPPRDRREFTKAMADNRHNFKLFKSE